MCQNWFSILGQLLDVVGFLTIAIEWHHQFKRDHDRRIGELQKAYERQSAELLGEHMSILMQIKTTGACSRSFSLQSGSGAGRCSSPALVS